MEFICAQERYHGEILKQLIARHEREQNACEQSSNERSVNSSSMENSSKENTNEQQKQVSNESEVKVYVCKVCGYEHIGSLDDEPDDYVCPLCHKGKEYFVEKE